jgi:hypothetical protein
VTVIGTAFIAVKPDMKGFGDKVGDGMGGAGNKAAKAGKGIGGKFSGALKASVALGSAAAVAGVAAFGKASIDAAQESVVAQSRLRNVFSSMGDKTGQATDAAIKYASALQSQTAIEDETIMAAQAKLATFGKVSDVTARQAGIFDRATKAAADLAATGFGSMESNSIQLGKALQDPVKGIAALGRAGVTFTAQEKARIKTLVESGKQTEAQKLVLGAIEKQVGGTAAATATASDKMKVAFGEVQESIGGALLPVVSAVAPLITDTFTKLGPILQRAAQAALGFIIRIAASVVAWFRSNWPSIRAIAVETFKRIAAVVVPIVQRLADFFTNTLLPAVGVVGDAVADIAPDIIGLFTKIGAIAGEVFPKLASVLDTIVPVLGKLIAKFVRFVGLLARNADIVLAILSPVLAYIAAMKVWAAIQAAVTVATNLWAAAQTALNVVLALNPIALIVLAIVGLVAALVVAYQKVGWFHDAVDALWQGVQVAFDFIIAAAKGVLDWLRNNWQTVLAIITGPVGLIVLLITKNWNTIKAATLAVWNGIKTAIGAAVNAVKAVVTGAWNTLKSVTSSVFNGIRNTISSVWATVKNTAKNAIDGVVSTVTGLPGRVAALATRMLNAGKDIGGALLNGIKSGISAAAGFAGDVASSVLGVVKGAWNEFARRINSLIPDKVGVGPFAVNFPDNPIPTFATGGLVPGRRGVPMLAIVHGGEYVTRADDVARRGGVGAAPAVAIASATFNDPVDVDVLIGRVGLAMASGRL